MTAWPLDLIYLYGQHGGDKPELNVKRKETHSLQQGHFYIRKGEKKMIVNKMCFAWIGMAADSSAQCSCGEHGLQRNQRVIHVNKSSTIAGFFLGEPAQAKLKKRLQNDVNSCV